MQKKIIVSIICYANFCRSPVAEFLLKNKGFENVVFNSFGLNPKVSSSMDPRSQRFLKDQGIPNIIHCPKKVSKKDLEESTTILALDHILIMELNRKFPSFKKKIKLLSFKNPKIILDDPYRYNDENYTKVMRKINTVCNNLNEVDFLV